jgi:hypothetical protein
MFAANGPPPVTVTQPVNVQVINSDTAPVQTQDVDNPAFQPFQLKQEFSYLEGTLGRAASVSVPPGKRLVIEFISVFAILPTGQNPTTNWIQVTNINGISVNHYFSASFQGNYSATENIFVGSTPTRLYCNPGSTFQIFFRRNKDTGAGLAFVSLSGYYVNVP